MDSSVDYFQKLYDDLIEQFKGKPNISVFQKAMARQLEEAYAFFYELRVYRWLQNAEGIQLDGIGNIAGLSRTEALIWSNMAGQNIPMDDELYRLYLWFKIFLNTSEGTYGDIVRTMKMFWPDMPFFYSEHIEIPATMFFTTEPLPIWETDLRVLQIVTRVKAAGVALHFIIPAPVEEDVMTYFAAGGAFYIKQYIICDTPEWPTDTTGFHAAAPDVLTRWFIAVDGPELYGDVTGFSAGAAAVAARGHIVVDSGPLYGGITDVAQ